MKLLVGSVVIAIAGYLLIDTGVDAVTAVTDGSGAAQFVVSHWYVWLVVALLSGSLWFVIGLSSAFSILRGGRGGSGPYDAPVLIKASAAVGACLFLAAIALRLIS